MGIRFLCPRGHELHVKDFLAGKRAICPDCGVKLRVPEQSDPAALEAREKRKRQAQPTAATVATAPTHDAEPMSVRSASKDVDSQNGTAAAARSSVASIAWFVRPPSGGQFGPADDATLKSWATAGRLTSDSYVWRQGWDDWQLASEVLAGLLSLAPKTAPAGSVEASAPSPRTDSGAEGTEVPTIKLSPVDSLDALSTTEVPTSGGSVATMDELPKIDATIDTSRAGRTELYRKRKSTKMFSMMVVILSLACAVLLAALVYVIRY